MLGFSCIKNLLGLNILSPYIHSSMGVSFLDACVASMVHEGMTFMRLTRDDVGVEYRVCGSFWMNENFAYTFR